MTPEEFGKILAERDIEKIVTHRAQAPDSCWGIVKHYAYCFRLGLTAPPIWGRVGRAYSKRMREGAQK